MAVEKENKKENVDVDGLPKPEVDVLEIKNELDAIKKMNEELKAKNDELLNQNKTLTESLENIFKKLEGGEDIKKEEVKKEKEGIDIVKEEFLRMRQKQEETLKSQKELEIKKKEEELNKKLLVLEAKTFSAENPHLAPLINDLMSNDDSIKSIDDLRKKITPTMEETYRKAYELEMRNKKAGDDPFKDYEGEKELKDIDERKARIEKKLKFLREGGDPRQLIKIK